LLILRAEETKNKGFNIINGMDSEEKNWKNSLKKSNFVPQNCKDQSNFIGQEGESNMKTYWKSKLEGSI